MKNLNLFRKSARGSEGSTLASAVVRPSFDRRLTVVKHLAFMLLFLLGSLNVWGEDVEIVSTFAKVKNESPTASFTASNTGSNNVYSTGTTFTITSKENNVWTLAPSTSGSIYFSMNNSEGGFHLGSKNYDAGDATLTSSTSFLNVTQIKISGKTGKSGSVTISVKVGNTSISLKQGSSETFSGSTVATATFISASPISGTVEVTMTDGASNIAYYIESITITTSSDSSDPTACAEPTFSIADGGKVYNGQTITLASTTENADIYYTMGADPVDPTISSTPYNGSIEISGTTSVTVKAIAVKDGMDNSSVATATYTIVPKLTSLQAVYGKAVEVGNTATDVYITFNDWKISGVKNRNAFLTDGTNGAVIYSTSNSAFVVNDVLSGTVACKVQLYNGFAEITSLIPTTQGLTVTSGSELTPAVKTLDQLSAVNTGALVTLENLTYDGTQLSDGVNTIKTYTTFYSASLVSGKTYNITGIYQYYQTAGQILPRNVDDIKEVTEAGAPEAPTFSVAAGTYTSVQSVELSCATEGATIYYTTDGATPTTESTEYTTAINVGENMTIKAIAIKDTKSSSVAEATYVINLPEDENVRKTWDLSVASYSANSEDQVTWSATYVNMVADKYNSTTAANNYLGGDANNRTSSRFYKDSKLTITPSDKQISTIVFTATSESYATALAGSTWTNATAEATGSVVTVTAAGTGAVSAVVGATCGFTAVQVNYGPIDTSVPDAPTFSPAAGTYTEVQNVTITCATEGATIYYTTDGATPDNTSTEYTSAISVGENMTIKAIAYKGDDHSEIASATYTITPALTDYYEKVTSGDVAEGTYLIVYEAGNVAFNGGLETLDAVSNTIDVTIVGDKIGVTPATEAATFYIDPTAGTIQSASGKYIGRTANTNGLNESATEAYTNTLSIDGDGNAVIVGSGSTATYLRYNPSNGQTRFRYFTQNQQLIALYKLANEVIKPASGLAWDPADDIELTVGDALSAPALLNPNNIPAGEITIESSNTDVATVSEGVVSLVENGIGTTTISATYTGETYKPITVSYKIKVNPAYSIYVDKLNVNFGSVEKNALVADKTITVTLTNVAVATATLAGDGASAFSIDPIALTESGNITISANSATVGTYAATITISDDAGNAESKVVNLSLIVTEPAGEETPVSTTSKWVAATAADLVDGAEVLITGVKSEVTYAMSEQANNNRTTVAGTLAEGVFTPGDNTMSFTLVEQASGKFALLTSNGKYLYAASSSSNQLKTRDDLGDDGKAVWSISIDGENKASIVANCETTNWRNTMRFNLNNPNPPVFACYASATQNDVILYVPKPAPAPEYETVRSGLEINRYYTVCLPKKVTAIKGASFWTLNNKSQDGATAYLEEETNNLPFAAGKPFIIQATAEKLEVVYEGAATEDAGINGALHGTLVYMDAAALAAAGSDVYMLFSNELRPVGEDNHLDKNRAYVKLSELNPVAEAPQSALGKRVRAMPMQPQVATGLENGELMNDAMVKKVLINGQLFILRGEKVYDAKGQLVK